MNHSLYVRQSARPVRRHLAALAAMAGCTALLAACGGDDARPLGESVEVDFYDDQSAKVGSGTVAVTDVRKGSTDEMVEDGGFTLDPDEEGAEVYYLDVTFENESDVPVQPHSPGLEDPDGNLISPLTVIDLAEGEVFEACPGVPDEIAPGEKAEGCAIVMIVDDREAEQAYYHPGGADDFVYWSME